MEFYWQRWLRNWVYQINHYSFTFTGDTTISGNSYHKLFVPVVVVTTVPFSSCPTGIFPGHYAGGIRQDTAIRKVFFIPAGTNTEELLYDFTMQTGDTVTGYTNRFSNPNITVQSIDSILVGNDYRKRWNLSPALAGIYFIEGIGSVFGLIEIAEIMIDGPSYGLSCFSQENVVLYPDTVATCQLITHVKNNFTKSFSANISPNPFHTSAMLKVSVEFENAKLKIYNTLGILIKEDRLVQQASFLLKRGELFNGIYFLQLMNDKGQAVVIKFVIE